MGRFGEARSAYVRRTIVATALLWLALATGLAGWSGGPGGGPDQAAATGVDSNGYPRVASVNSLSSTDWTQLEKYHEISAPGGAIKKIAQLKTDLAAKGRSIIALRYFSARAYQNDKTSMPWADTYPGHWLFAAGTTTSAYVDATTTTIPVASVAPFQGRVGYYAMIWNGKAKNASLTPDDVDFWDLAEHVKITSVGTSSITVTRGIDGSSGNLIATPGFSHPAGSHVAIHVPGAGTPPPEVGSDNMSTHAPRDTSGQQPNLIMANWLGLHLNDLYDTATKTYTAYAGAFDGVQFDATSHWISGVMSGQVDVNNDMVPDGGIVQPGRSTWGEGMDLMLEAVRAALGPDTLIVGGSMRVRGLAYLNGTQFEGFPDGARKLDYTKWDAALQLYFAWQEKAGLGLLQPHSTIFTGAGTAVHGTCGDANPGPNSSFRFGLGSALLSDGYFAYANGCFGDYWWDEYAVDLGTGEAVSLAAGVDTLAAHTGYLGQPLGPARRLLDPTTGPNLVDERGWALKLSQGAAATASQPAPGSELAVSITSPGLAPGNIQLRYPASFVAGDRYTVRFWARADNGRNAIDVGRDIDVAITGSGMATIASTFFITGEWREYWLEFVPPATTAGFIQFRLGREGGSVWLDHVGLYKGSSGLFRRDFQNGIAVVNGTSATQTVPLGGTFRKILGTQDPGFNDGAAVTSVTLAPHDAIILLRLTAAPDSDVGPDRSH